MHFCKSMGRWMARFCRLLPVVSTKNHALSVLFRLCLERIRSFVSIVSIRPKMAHSRCDEAAAPIQSAAGDPKRRFFMRPSIESGGWMARPWPESLVDLRSRGASVGDRRARRGGDRRRPRDGASSRSPARPGSTCCSSRSTPCGPTRSAPTAAAARRRRGSTASRARACASRRRTRTTSRRSRPTPTSSRAACRPITASATTPASASRPRRRTLATLLKARRLPHGARS